jgi:exonuclease V gamma subunit
MDGIESLPSEYLAGTLNGCLMDGMESVPFEYLAVILMVVWWMVRNLYYLNI